MFNIVFLSRLFLDQKIQKRNRIRNSYQQAEQLAADRLLSGRLRIAAPSVRLRSGPSVLQVTRTHTFDCFHVFKTIIIFYV